MKILLRKELQTYQLKLRNSLILAIIHQMYLKGKFSINNKVILKIKDPYFNRATKIFEKIYDLHVIFLLQGNVDEEKLNRYKSLELILQNFEDNISNITASKKQKLDFINEKVSFKIIDLKCLKVIARRGKKQISNSRIS